MLERNYLKFNICQFMRENGGMINNDLYNTSKKKSIERR